MTVNLKWLSRSPNLLVQAVDLIKNTINFIVDWFFGFSTSAAQRRGLFRLVFFMVLLVFFGHAEFIRNATAMQHYRTLIAVWQSGQAGDLLTQALISFVWAVGSVMVSLPVLRELLVIFVPYFLALEFAAIYQQDVFEKEVEITRTFISQAVFAEHYNVIHVREGRVIAEDEESPILLIGGPGLVEVELDSAAMFEDVDYKPRVIGPTGKYRGGLAVINGFERIRQSFDLRERSVNIPSIKARSRDGIEVEAKDLHYVFSVNRGTVPPTKDNPYPFDETSLINFVYNGPPPKGPGWKSPIATDINMPITLELIGFISKRSVGEFLASVGQPELEALEQRKQARDEAVRKLAGDAQPGDADTFPKQGEFTSRPKISDLLNSESFLKNVSGKGFSLRWVGVGTWNTAAQVIPELHLEAWEVSRGNVMRGSEMALNKIRENAKYDHLLELLSQVVLAPYYDHSEDIESTALVNRWLVRYYERLLALREAYEKEHQPIPETLTKALDILTEALPIHPVGEPEE